MRLALGAFIEFYARFCYAKSKLEMDEKKGENCRKYLSEKRINTEKSLDEITIYMI